MAVASALAAGVLAGWVQLESMRQAARTTDRVERTLLVRLAAERLRAAVRTAQADAVSYLLAGTETYLARVNDARLEGRRQLHSLTEFGRDDPALQSALASLSPAVADAFDTLAQAVRAPAERRAGEAVRLAGPGPMRLAVDQALRALADFDTELMRRVEREQLAKRNERWRALTLVVGANALLFGLLAAILFILTRGPVRRRLAASEQRYHVLFNQAPLPMWVYDPTTLTLLDVNDAALRRYGYSREEFLQLALRDLRPAEEVPALEAALRDLPPQRYGLEWHHKTRAGEILDVRIFAADTDFDGRRARLVLAEDITAYRAVEAETHRLREQLALTLDGMYEAVCLFSRDGRFLFVNERAHRLATVRRPVQIGMKIEENFPEFIGTPPLQALYRAADTGQAQRVEEFAFETGVWVEFRFYPHGDTVLVFVTNITKRKIAEGLLREREADLVHLSHLLLRAQEEERRRIAREMHDQLGQELIALKMNLQTARADSPAGQRRLNDSTTIVEQLIEQARDLSLDLHPSILDDVGLAAALEWLSARQSERSGVPIEVRGERPLPRLTRETEAALFRIVQEAISNALKHAHARSVTVTLRHDPTQLEISVQDDGCGFEPELAQRRDRDSLGLISMRERADLIGAALDVRSSPGAGTWIVVRLGLPQRELATSAQGGAVG
ncbi:MAG TPA: ATP-binding protein [Burkholderiaceae bacterium]|nr:ATP-binding protein [Burkholderiaceae bacterium]